MSAKNRRPPWLMLSIALVAMAAILGKVIWDYSSRPRVTIDPAAFEKIEQGMTEEEVLKIVGVPFGDYTTGPTLITHLGVMPGSGTVNGWTLDTEVYSVWFENGTVIFKSVLPAQRMRTPIGKRLRWLIIPPDQGKD